MTKTEKFTTKIVNNSRSNNFNDCREEWNIKKLFVDSSKSTECICGQQHIKYGVIIKNKFNNNTLSIGSNCAKTLMYFQIDSTEYKKLLAFEKLLSEGIRKIPNIKEIIIAHKYKIITNWEIYFMLNMLQRSSFTLKQINVLKRIVNREFFKKEFELNKVVSYHISNNILVVTDYDGKELYKYNIGG